MTTEADTRSETRHDAGRRAFLTLAAAAPAAALAATSGAAVAAEPERPSALGYRKTEHVKKYLDSARF